MPRTCPVEWVEAEHPLFLLYTSGSTGKPKGVLHTTGGYMVGVGEREVWGFTLVCGHEGVRIGVCFCQNTRFHVFALSARRCTQPLPPSTFSSCNEATFTGEGQGPGKGARVERWGRMKGRRPHFACATRLAFV